MSVGDNIKKRRFELKMSQQELAEALGYKTRSTIAKIESGENDVSHKKLLKFAAALDTSVEMLVSDYGVLNFGQKVEDAEPLGGKNVVIILAGGKSGRNRQNIPSQFIDVKGKPILAYSMEAYQSHPMIDDIFVVSLKGWESIVKSYAKQYSITKLRGIISGGASGISSLKNAVDLIKERYSDDSLIIIQESTRPLISSETVSKLIQSAGEVGSATICHRMNDYVQFELCDNRAKYVDRESVVALQSPEAHRLSIINEVFLKAENERHILSESCCTMLLYNLGYDINFIEGGFNNIKITREEDLAAFSVMV